MDCRRCSEPAIHQLFRHVLDANALRLESLYGLNQIEYTSERCFLFNPSATHSITLQSLLLVLIRFLFSYLRLHSEAFPWLAAYAQFRQHPLTP